MANFAVIPAGLVQRAAAATAQGQTSTASSGSAAVKKMKPSQLWNILQLPPNSTASTYYFIDFRKSRTDYDQAHVRGFRWVGLPVATGRSPGNDDLRLCLDEALAHFQGSAVGRRNVVPKPDPKRRHVLIYICDDVVALQSSFAFQEVHQVAFAEVAAEFPAIIVSSSPTSDSAAAALQISTRYPISFSQTLFCGGSAFFERRLFDDTIQEDAAVGGPDDPAQQVVEGDGVGREQAVPLEHLQQHGLVLESGEAEVSYRAAVAGLAHMVSALGITELLLVLRPAGTSGGLGSSSSGRIMSSSGNRHSSGEVVDQAKLGNFLLDVKHHVAISKSQQDEVCNSAGTSTSTSSADLKTTALPLAQAVSYLGLTIPPGVRTTGVAGAAAPVADRVCVLSADDNSSAAAAVTGYFLETKKNWPLNIALAFAMKKIPTFNIEASQFSVLSTLNAAGSGSSSDAASGGTSTGGNASATLRYSANNLTRDLLNAATAENHEGLTNISTCYAGAASETGAEEGSGEEDD
eukprot:g10551.t1